jgi:hypothetical protein
MDQGSSRRKAIGAALLGGALALAVAATAFAAHPKSGKSYSGFTSAPSLVGFRAPVTFQVSSSGAKLVKFTYGSLSCFGGGGFQQGVNPYTGVTLIKVGTIAVSTSGKFSVNKAKSTFHFHSGSISGTTTTTSVIGGRFTDPNTATGTIRFSQVAKQSNLPQSSSCHSVKRSFTAKLK